VGTLYTGSKGGLTILIWFIHRYREDSG